MKKKLINLIFFMNTSMVFILLFYTVFKILKDCIKYSDLVLDYEVARNLSLSHLNPIMIIIIIGLFLGEFILLVLEEKIERDYSLSIFF